MKGQNMIDNDNKHIAVHDGFVELIDTFGTDIDIVNAARVSFGVSSDTLTTKDLKLMTYLWSHQHTSPFRMVTLKFKIKAPIFVLRQWMKHQIGCTWNEISARYVAVGESFYHPKTWRKQHPTSKQSSYDQVDDTISKQAMNRLDESYRVAYENYRWMLSQGICREQARIQLPVGMYSECIWKVDLQALFHFLSLRLDSHAQVEIQEFAKAVQDLCLHAFPFATSIFMKALEIDKELASTKKDLWDNSTKQLFDSNTSS